jgi:hypothetical protein
MEVTEEMMRWQYYGTEGLQVVPYMAGTPVFKDGALSLLYYQTRDEGKLDAVFCGDVISHDSFVNFFYTRKTMQVLCEVEANKDLKPVGYSWIDLPKGVDGARSAHTGFCFFNGASERSSARDLARLGIAYWLVALKVNVLHGVLLESNTAAKNFALKVGYKEVCVVPSYHFHDGVLEGARVMVLDGEEWLPTFEDWRKENPVAKP